MGMEKELELTGLEVAFPGNRYILTLTALSSVSICRIPVQLIEKFILLNGDLRKMLMDKIRRKMEYTFKYSILMITGSVEAKVAFALLALSSKDDIVIIPKEDMARMTGLTRETVSRKLKLFATAKIIEVGQRNVKILRKAELLKFLRGVD